MNPDEYSCEKSFCSPQSSVPPAHHWIRSPSSEPRSRIFWSYWTVPPSLKPALVCVLAALRLFHLGGSTLRVWVTIDGKNRQETATPPTERRLQNWQRHWDNNLPTNNICFVTLMNSESWLKHRRLKDSGCLNTDKCWHAAFTWFFIFGAILSCYPLLFYYFII